MTPVDEESQGSRSPQTKSGMGIATCRVQSADCRVQDRTGQERSGQVRTGRVLQNEGRFGLTTPEKKNSLCLW